jgi:hypothetical protein
MRLAAGIGNRLTFGFRKREPNIFDGEGHRHPRRAVALVDDFAAVRLVHLAVEQRTRENVERDMGIDATLAQQGGGLLRRNAADAVSSGRDRPAPPQVRHIA